MLALTTDEELLRLARKAWPLRKRLTANVSQYWADIYCEDAQRPVIEIRTEHEGAPTREALHAALKVLSWETQLPSIEGRNAFACLSPRERELVERLCAGRRLSEVARAMFISSHTARNHLKHAFRKLGVHSQVELVAKFGGGRG